MKHETPLGDHPALVHADVTADALTYHAGNQAARHRSRQEVFLSRAFLSTSSARIFQGPVTTSLSSPLSKAAWLRTPASKRLFPLG